MSDKQSQIMSEIIAGQHVMQVREVENVQNIEVVEKEADKGWEVKNAYQKMIIVSISQMLVKSQMN